MKFLFTPVFLLFLALPVFSQSDAEIGAIYVEKSEASLLEGDLDSALEYFSKARRYIKEIEDSNVARVGAMVSNEVRDYTKAKILTQLYFDLNPDNKTSEYQDMLLMYVNIEEAMEAIAIEDEKLRLEKLEQERQQRRLDSLTAIWTAEYETFLINMDSITAFNSYNIAAYFKGGNVGIMDHLGQVLVEANTYKEAIEYDGFVLLLDNVERPTRIYAYNAASKDGYQLPSVTQFLPQAYDFGHVMLPRSNGMLVTYPSNANNVFIYDLNTKKYMDNPDMEDQLKTMKKNDIIDRFNSDLEIRMDKNWYTIGNALGGGLHPIYNSKKELHGFLNTYNGKMFDASYYKFVGPFCSGKYQIIEDGNSLWMDTEGVKFETLENKSGTYSGNSKFVKNTNGTFQILKEVDGKDHLIFKDKSLVVLEDFLIKNNVGNSGAQK